MRLYAFLIGIVFYSGFQPAYADEIGLNQGTWDIYILPVTGVLEFDYFYSLITYSGLFAMLVGWLFRVVSRS